MTTPSKPVESGESDLLLELVRSVARDMHVKIAFICQYVPAYPEFVRTLALSVDDQFLENLEYRVNGTPCRRVYEKGSLFHQSDVAQIYPEDRMLADWKLESYMGVAFYDSQGLALGHLGIMHDKPMEEDPDSMARLRRDANKAAIEIERRNTAG